MPNDVEEEGWILISLLFCGEADEQVIKELTQLVKVDPVLKNRLAILQACWKNSHIPNKDVFNKFYLKLLQRLPAD